MLSFQYISSNHFQYTQFFVMESNQTVINTNIFSFRFYFLQLRVVAQDVKCSAAQLDELYMLFKVSYAITNRCILVSEYCQFLSCMKPHAITRGTFLLQRQHFVSCYWSVSSPVLHNHDPSLPYLDQYQLDQSQFSSLFNLLQPWTTDTHVRSLTRSAFHILDENGDGLVNFKELICGLGKSNLILT